MNLARQVVVARFSFKERVADAAFSPDGKVIAVAMGRSIQLWCTPSLLHQFSAFSLLKQFTTHHDDVTSVSWSPNGRYIVSGSADLTCRIFSFGGEPGYIPVTLSGHREKIVSAVFGDDDTIYTVSADGALFVWLWKQLDASSSSSGALKAGKRPRSADGAGAGGAAALASKDRHAVPAPYSSSAASGAGSHDISAGEWWLSNKHYLRQEGGTRVTSAAFHRPRSLLVVGLSDGVFGIYSMPGCENVHTLSISQQNITAAAINAGGDWIAFGSSALSQLLVWEWTSETYVIKQQGHSNDVNCTAFSPNGQLIATGGDDGKVKVWNTASGFSFVTFAEHTAPVTAVSFVGGKKGHGLVVVSASLDGSVRAYDLVRYRNFKTFSAPGTPVQFSCVSGDESGEIVCAGGVDPFNVYVWSMQTGKLLDVFAGHQGPVSGLTYSGASGLLASCSWDRSVKLWDVYRSGTATETFTHSADVTSVAVRPDGQQLVCATLDGNLNIWDIKRGVQIGTIDARRDLAGGRKSMDVRTADANSASKHATSICYTADGSAILIGGNSRFVCLYALPSKMLVRRFVITHNRSIEGVLDKLNSKKIGDDGMPVPDDDEFFGSADTKDSRAKEDDALPGVKKGDAASKRNAKRSAWSKAVSFAPSGDMFTAVTPDGVCVYKQDETAAFDPFELGEDITMDAVDEALELGQHARATLLALNLNEAAAVSKAVDACPVDSIRLVVQAVPRMFIPRLVTQLAGMLSPNSPHSAHLEFALAWVLGLLQEHADTLKLNENVAAGLHLLKKALLAHRETLAKLCETNAYTLDFLCMA